MKKLVTTFVFLALCSITTAQTNENLIKHYNAFYKQMRLQGDVNGIINALTHLNVLQPSEQRMDTLAYIYMNNNQYMQALNTIGIDKKSTDSDLAIQVKAVSLKSLNQPKRALEQFIALYERNKNPYLAYEIADLQIQTGDTDGAASYITYGITNATDDMKHAFFERQQPYEVSLKAAFYHLQGLLIFNEDKTKIDEAIAQMDKALEIAPTFNLASLSKQALETRKNEGTETQE
ncbi:hypothetical protein BUL40_00140 [Croceivirga radicis]|uniref:Tetratricopeptide repeat protein n=1 Tax=Croceivirga radicis TaxID=1929488 RepID=A0A1V6LUZ7_9FLAO|nr:hypothetical protein [Croceivirga radicis]OQD44001.1 hypothetical protein BUL40_00140 [Croceivirga radicis]